MPPPPSLGARAILALSERPSSSLASHGQCGAVKVEAEEERLVVAGRRSSVRIAASAIRSVE
jgi:hypothetical protein